MATAPFGRRFACISRQRVRRFEAASGLRSRFRTHTPARARHKLKRAAAVPMNTVVRALRER